MLEKIERRQSFQTLSWFKDLYKRGLLDLEPPYQRRSVWSQRYRDFFIETILLQYPAPAIFLHEDMSEEGIATYSVVDGKQRLTTIFDFTDDKFAVAEDSALERLQGSSFSELDQEVRKTFWKYQFSVEYLPTVDEGTLNSVFDRINRNVARLTRQELRHAKFDGHFAKASDRLNEYLAEELPPAVPRIAATSKNQMKDVELVAQLLLLVESGPQSFSQDELDDAYGARDDEWDREIEVEKVFRQIIDFLAQVFEALDTGGPARRLKNQADFYSLFGVVLRLREKGTLPLVAEVARRLERFMRTVEDSAAREASDDATNYYAAARSASNDLKQRLSRIDILERALTA